MLLSANSWIRYHNMRFYWLTQRIRYRFSYHQICSVPVWIIFEINLLFSRSFSCWWTPINDIFLDFYNVEVYTMGVSFYSFTTKRPHGCPRAEMIRALIIISLELSPIYVNNWSSFVPMRRLFIFSSTRSTYSASRIRRYIFGDFIGNNGSLGVMVMLGVYKNSAPKCLNSQAVFAKNYSDFDEIGF